MSQSLRIATSDDLFDALNDTMALRCCDCPSCNHYAPDYEQHKGKPCETWELIRAYADAYCRETHVMPPAKPSDRGAADTLWLNLGALLVGLGCGSYLWPPLAWALVGLLAYLLLAVPLAICVGRVVRGGAR